MFFPSRTLVILLVSLILRVWQRQCLQQQKRNKQKLPHAYVSQQFVSMEYTFVVCVFILCFNFGYIQRGRRGLDSMGFEFTITCAISAYHHNSCELEPRSWEGVLDITLYDKFCQWLATGRWFSPCTPVSSTNKIDRHNITEILLKVALNTLKPNQANLYTDCLLIW